MVKKASTCPASKPWGVIKKTDGSVVGCHVSKESANKQVAALYAKEGNKSMSTDDTQTAFRPPRDGLFRAVFTQDGEDPVVGVRPLEVELRDDSDGSPIMEGYFARFNEWTEINSFFEGNFMERFAPGAFKKTISESRDRMKVLFQHGRDPSIGNKPLGPIRELLEKSRGAWYEVDLLDADYVRELLPGLRAKLYGASFRFRVVREDINEEPGRSDHNPNGIPERTVKEAHVMEFGPVTFPAYQNATAGVRSLTDEFIFESFARDPDKLRELISFARQADLAGAGVDTDATVDTVNEAESREDEATETKEDAPPVRTAEEQPHRESGRRDKEREPQKRVTPLYTGDTPGKDTQPSWQV